MLITGESGTGKELAARALHDASPRRDGPFEVVDCGGRSPTLIEAELFGHERGAFTGAAGDRAGAFERADGGTFFLDELGELPQELQPEFLRALAEHDVRRVGGPRACARSTCASWRPPTASCAARCTRGASAPTSSIASR